MLSLLLAKYGHEAWKHQIIIPMPTKTLQKGARFRQVELWKVPRLRSGKQRRKFGISKARCPARLQVEWPA